MQSYREQPSNSGTKKWRKSCRVDEGLRYAPYSFWYLCVEHAGDGERGVCVDDIVGVGEVGGDQAENGGKIHAVEGGGEEGGGKWEVRMELTFVEREISGSVTCRACGGMRR